MDGIQSRQLNFIHKERVMKVFADSTKVLTHLYGPTIYNFCYVSYIDL